MYSDRTNLKNPYSVDVLFRPSTYKHIQETLILPKVNEFLAVRGITSANEINRRDGVTDLNFHNVDIKYFYNKLLKNIKKEQGTIDLVQYAITYDKKFALLQCEETGLFYNELLLGEKPILYFIYFDLQEILDSIRRYSQR